MKPSAVIKLALAVFMLTRMGPARAEFMAYWYVIHNTEEKTYSDYFGGVDPQTLQGTLPPHLAIEKIFECDIMGNTSGIRAQEVEDLVKKQFRKETFSALSEWDPPNNPYVKITPFYPIIEYCSEFYHLNHNYVKALILKESGAQPGMTGPDGEIGLMQIRPDDARRMIQEQKLENFNTEKLYDPAWNIAFGCYFLHQLTEEFAGSVDNIIAAYYRGKEDVIKMKNKPFDSEVSDYIDRVVYLTYIFDSFPQPGDRVRSVVK